MTDFVEFHLESQNKKRSFVEFSVEGDNNISLQIQKPQSNKLSTSYLAPKREVDVLEEILPDDVVVITHQESLIQEDNQIKPYSDAVVPIKKALKKKSISILVLDPFAFNRKILPLIEYQVRIIRILLAKKNIATTFHRVCAVNSANYQAFKNEHFNLFENTVFPINLLDLSRFDIVLNLESIIDQFDEKEPLFEALNECIINHQ